MSALTAAFLSPSLSFAGSCLPAIRRSVKNAVLLQLKDWLVVVREQSRIVGELAMEQVTRRAGADPQSAVGAAVDKRRQRHVSLRSAHSSQSMLPIEMVMHEENESTTAWALVFVCYCFPSTVVTTLIHSHSRPREQ